MDERTRGTPAWAGFAARLGELRLAAGKPSYETLARLGRRLHRSTIGDALSGRTLPSLEFVRDFVDACNRHAARLGITIDPRLVDKDYWLAQWRAAHGSPPAAESGPGVAWPVPRQLPPTGGLLVGRDRELAELDAQAPGAIVLVSGMGGVGKSALVTHWAHRRRDRHPDGELWLDLRAYSGGGALEPAEALAALLRALGLAPTMLPGDVAELSALFRSTVAQRRMLVVLDNSAGAEHVRPLLPAGPDCTTVVISRDCLPGLVAREGAIELGLGPLTGPAGAELLEKLVKTTATDDLDPAAATELAALCGGLPLALRVVGERLHWESPAQVRHELRGTHNRLTALSLADDPGASIGRVLASSLDHLPGPAGRMLRLLTVHPGPTFPLAAAAALGGVALDEARLHLGRLARTSLVEVSGPDRYRLHDLVRLAAAEQLSGAADPADRTEAVGRLLAWHRHTTAAAARLVYPGMAFPDPPPPDPVPGGADPPRTIAGATAWFAAELDALPGLVEVAIAEGHHATAAWTVVEYTVHFIKALPYPASLALLGRAVDASARMPDGDRAHSMAMASRALLLDRLGRHRESRETTARNTELARRLGDPRQVVMNLVRLGLSWLTVGDANRAADAFAEAHAEIGDHDWPHDHAWVAVGRSAVMLGNGRAAEAARTAATALATFRDLNDVSGQAFALRVLTRSLAEQGRVAEALEAGEAAVALTALTTDHVLTALSLTTLADVHDHAGDSAGAEAARNRARRLTTA